MYDYMILFAVMIVSVMVFLYLSKLFLNKMLSDGKFLYLFIIIPILAVVFRAMIDKEYDEFLMITGRKHRPISQSSFFPPGQSPLVAPVAVSQRSTIRIPLWGGISISL